MLENLDKVDESFARTSAAALQEGMPDPHPLACDEIVERLRPLISAEEKAVQDEHGRSVQQWIAAWLDKPNAALAGMTPLQAASRPEMRESLTHQVKCRIRTCDEINLQVAGIESIDWIIGKLGLTEIAYPPPPPRPIPAEFQDEDLLPAPRLPAQPLSHAEALARLNAVTDAFRDRNDLYDEFEAAGGWTVGQIDQLFGKYLTDAELDFAAYITASAAFALVPPGHEIPEMDHLSITQAFSAYVNKTETGAPLPNDFLRGARQPNLLTEIGFVCKEQTKKGVASEAAAMVIMLFVRAFTDELDRQLRC